MPPAGRIHSVISWCFPLSIEPGIVINREVTAWSKVNQDSFRAALLEAELCSVDHHAATTNDFFELYNSMLTRLAEQFAPVKRLTMRRQRLALWMDGECHQLRRRSRMLDRCYRRTRLAADGQAWVDHERHRHQIYRKKERVYWSARICGQAKQPRQLWRSLNTLMGVSDKSSLPKNCPSAQQFADFFEAKVAAGDGWW